MVKNLQLFKKISRQLGFISFFMLIVFTLQAQILVTGVVKDGIEDIPLPGVSVVQKGSGNVSITDLDGVYSMEVADAQAELVFSFIGFETQNVVVGNRTTIDITLVAEETLLEQVVVVGYGTQKKINLTGAVDQVSGEDIIDRPVGNVMQSLQGVSPGLNITYSGGRPGSIPNINIRGFTSINGGGPLIVLD